LLTRVFEDLAERFQRFFVIHRGSSS
jgi:hypothetical protein